MSLSEYQRRRQSWSQFGKPPKPPKEKKGIAKKSAKALAAEKAEREERGGDDTELVKWFKSRQKQLKGKCIRCGTPHNIKDFDHAIKVTAHILAKRDTMFPSVKTHPLNWIELGFYCDCHNWFDNVASWEDIANDPIWPIVLERFLQVEPNIAAEERHRLPEVLQQEIKPAI